MMGISGDIVKNLRKQLNLTQEVFAEKISMSTSTLYRIENNKAEMDMLEYMNILRTFDMPLDDFFLMFLDNQEYQEYKIYMKAYTFFSSLNFSQWQEEISKLKKSLLMDNKYVQLHLAYGRAFASIYSRTTNPGTYTMDDLEAFLKAIRITINDFDEAKITDYLLEPREFTVLREIVVGLLENSQYERAINICNALLNNESIKNRKDFLIAADVHLVDAYYRMGMYSNALNMALETYALCLDGGIYANIPAALIFAAVSSKKLGEDEQIYRMYITRAYYFIVLQGINVSILLIKQTAKDELGIDLEDWIIKW